MMAVESAKAGMIADDDGDLALYVKQVHGVRIFLSDNGMFYAKFSQGNGAKTFERASLVPLEILITQHVASYTGHVPVGSRPVNLIGDKSLEALRNKLAGNVGRYETGILPVRPTTDIVGVQRKERLHGGGTTVMFRTADGNSAALDSEYVKPNVELDGQYRDLVEAYAASQQAWRDRFAAIIDQYETITAPEVVAELKRQGAATKGA